MKNKYNCEEWFKDKILLEQITVKDALKLSVASTLERHLVILKSSFYFFFFIFVCICIFVHHYDCLLNLSFCRMPSLVSIHSASVLYMLILSHLQNFKIYWEVTKASRKEKLVGENAQSK